MIRIIIFIIILFLTMPYINKAKDKILNKMPDTIPLNKTSEIIKEKIKK